MVDVRENYARPLTVEMLFAWHEMLMAGSTDIIIGNWRVHNEPMQVVSGALGKEKVHFEAPPSARIPGEMERFIRWFNDTAPCGKQEIKRAPVRSAIAHLYFESLHPFEDGNGRIGRAIAEKALSQTMGRPVLLSLSRTIEADRKSYYNALEKAQRTDQVTKWVKYFVTTIIEAQKQMRYIIEFTLKKTKFFDQFKEMLNERQLKVIKKIMDAGHMGFEGGVNANKYMSIAKVSKATATRDLQYLADIKVLLPEGGGRSTRYVLHLDGV
jgi:Fic family protein